LAHTATGGGDPDESSAPVQLDPSVVAGIHGLSQVLRVHRSGRRDICIGREHHVVVAASRNEYFIDPSHTDRLRFNASQADALTPSPHGVTVRTLKKSSDADAMNRVFCNGTAH
jgi:hypothetical protein